MKKPIIISLLLTASVFAETASIDITISDLKEATYRLIKDVQKLKGNTKRPKTEITTMINELKQKQKNVAFVKKHDDADDLFIKQFILNNASELNTK